MTTDSEPSVIVLWVHPRSTSTMFERLFLNLEGPGAFRVLHEPGGDSWYFGPERSSQRYSAEHCAQEYPQYKDVTVAKNFRDTFTDPKKLPGNETNNAARTFIKDMAQYWLPIASPAASTPGQPDLKKDGNPTFIPTDQLLAPHIRHTFLFRSPAKAVPSYYRLCIPPASAKTGFEYFDPEEVGLRELRELYTFLSSKLPEPPILIDSDDLIASPKEYIKVYCNAVGVPFTDDIMQWTAGSQKHFDKWAGFHDDAQNSTGIGTQKKCTSEQQSNWPKVVEQAIEDNVADYEWLRERRLRL